MVKNVLSDFTASGEYITPDVKILIFHSEGVLCGSVTATDENGMGHEGFGNGGSYDL